MAKANPLTQALKDSVTKKPRKRATDTDQAAPAAPANGQNYRRPSRVGTIQIAGFYPRDIHIALKMIAVQEGKTLQEVVGEAFDLLLINRGKPALVAQYLAEETAAQ